VRGVVNIKNDYADLAKEVKPQRARQMVRHPLFGYVALTGVLLTLQLLFIVSKGDIIPLNISQAIMQTMIYAVAGLGVGILLMMSGLLSFGTGAFIGMGSYLAAWFLKRANIPYIFIMIIVAAVAVVVGVIIGFVSLRVRGTHLIILTLGLAVVLYTLYSLPNDLTGGPMGISKVPYPKLFMFIQTKRDTVYFVVLAVLLFLIIVTQNIINSPMGRAMLATATSESLAQAMGINILKYRVLAFVIATVYSMLSGVLYVSYMQSSVYSTWSTSLAMNILIAVILGGTAKPAGVLIGSFVIFTVDSAFLKRIPFFKTYPQASLFFTGFIIILIIAKYPGGLIRLMGDISALVRKLYAKWRLHRYGPDEV